MYVVLLYKKKKTRSTKTDGFLDGFLDEYASRGFQELDRLELKAELYEELGTEDDLARAEEVLQGLVGRSPDQWSYYVTLLDLTDKISGTSNYTILQILLTIYRYCKPVSFRLFFYDRSVWRTSYCALGDSNICPSCWRKFRGSNPGKRFFCFFLFLFLLFVVVCILSRKARQRVGTKK